jgi:SAM-dependent methyltransferase
MLTIFNYYETSREPMVAQSKQAYDSSFFDGQSQGSRASAAVVVPIVRDIIRPTSILDVGCGVATWLAEWVNQGVTDVLGLDGEYVDKRALQIESAKFIPTDLRQTFSLGRKFDLVQSLEVAEHIDQEYADLFVEALTNHGDIVLFSAAIPGQGGTHHVNEQWPSYWIEKFMKADFKLYDIIRPRIWADSRIKMWYRQNILLFSKERVFDAPETCINVIHPELWKLRTDYKANPRLLVRSLPGALSLALRRKLHLPTSRLTSAVADRGSSPADRAENRDVRTRGLRSICP